MATKKVLIFVMHCNEQFFVVVCLHLHSQTKIYAVQLQSII